jgi:hypothetical protein
MMEKFRLRDKELADTIYKKLKKMDLNIRLMHVCGTHQDTTGLPGVRHHPERDRGGNTPFQKRKEIGCFWGYG